jgi:broad specificity phosphatase PhoE
MRIYIVRHGQTNENLNKVSQGHFNSQLTSLGIEQAKDISKKLKNIEITHAYSSDLDRCVKTAEEILKYHQKVILIQNDKLREQAKGVFERQHSSEFKKAVEESQIPYEDFKPEKGESLRECWERAITFFEDLIKEHDEMDQILIVSHGGPISCILTHLHKDKIENTKEYSTKGNTSLSVINIDQSKEYSFELVNSLQHLELN